VAGCGLPQDRSPHELSPDNVPFGLLQPSTSTTQTSAPSPTTRTATVYLVETSNDGVSHLVPVDREVKMPVGIDDFVRSLLGGSGRAEKNRGLTTSFPSATELLGTDLDGGVLTVNLSQALGDARGEAQKVAIAQIVYTVTERSSINAVRFKIDGKDVGVLIDGGSESTDPVDRNDYRSVAPTD
jgi:spore germination protein GerM